MKIGFLILSFILILSSGCGITLSETTTSGNRFNVPALTNWHKESGIRVSGALSPSIIRLNDGRYRIFYPGEGIISSISTDGLTFTPEEGERLSKGSGSDYDANGASDPDIVVEDGYYRMYYRGDGPDNKHRMMSAISTDGYTFTKEGVRINYDASYDQLANVPSVVRVNSQEYWAYFVYDFMGDNSIKGARSTDGLSWEVKTLSGFTNNCMDPEVILDADGKTLVMFFAAPGTTAKAGPTDIYKATSTDGINWTVVGQAIVPEKTEEGKAVGDPDVIRLPDGIYRMYYYGMQGPEGGGSDILSATAESL